MAISSLDNEDLFQFADAHDAITPEVEEPALAAP
jgi:hypothetical protein